LKTEEDQTTQIIEKILKSSEYDTEINITDKTDTSIEYERFPIPSHTESANLEIRITNGKKYGYASTTDLGKWKKCLANAKKIMNVSKPLEIEPKLPQKQKYIEKKPDKKLWSMDSDGIISLFQDMFDIKTKVRNAGITRSKSHRFVANSNGVFNSSESVAMSAAVQADYKRASSFGVKIDRKYFDTKQVSAEAEKFCMMSIKPQKIKTMVTDTIFDYFAISSLIEAILLPAFYADRVQAGTSFLCNKLDQALFSEKLHICDDGTTGLLSVPCDSEGVQSKRKILISNGVLKNYLYDSYSAQKDGKESTGNSVSISKRPNIGPSNVIIKDGKSRILDYSDSDCLVVRSLSGVHTSNPVSGDFSVTLDNAFYKGVAVKHAMISGNIFELLNNILSIGNRSRQDGIVKTAPIEFKDMQIVA
jgi:PmbA protein